MTAMPPDDRRRMLVSGAIFAGVGPIAAVASSGTFLLLALGLLGQSRETFRAAQELARRHWIPLVGLGVLLAWSVISMLWSPETGAASRILRIALLALGGWLLVAMVSTLGQAARHRVAAILVISGSLLAALLFVEFATNGLLNTLTRTWDLSALRMGRAPAIRGTAILAVLSWPIAHAIARRFRVVRGALLFLVAATAIALLFGMSASVVAMLIGAAAGGVTFLRRRLGAAITAAVFALVLIFGPLLAATAIDVPAIRASEIGPASWRHRLAIWDHASQLIKMRPLRGHGIDASRHVSDRISMLIDGEYTSVPLMPLHPHSAAFQIWFELGAVGVVAVLIGLAGFAEAVARSDGGPWYAATKVATMASFLTVSFLSFGIWQSWWLATGWLAAAAVALVRDTGRTAIT